MKKTLLSIPVTIIVGVLAILEIVFEVVYRLVKLLRRGYKLFADWFLELVKPIYTGKWKAKIKDENEIQIYTFDYEMKETEEESSN
jgi:hypothetical protein